MDRLILLSFLFRDLLNGEVALFKPKVLILMGPFCNTDTVLELEDGEKLQVDIGEKSVQ